MSIFRNRPQRPASRYYEQPEDEMSPEPKLFAPRGRTDEWQESEEYYPESDNVHPHPNWQQPPRGPNRRVSDRHPRELSFWREERFYDDYPQARRQASPLRFVLAVASLVIIAIFGWLIFRWVSAPQGGMPPLIMAEQGPYKIRPDHPGGMQIPYQDRLVYNRLSPDAKQPPEQLLPTPEQPMMLPQQQYAPQQQQAYPQQQPVYQQQPPQPQQQYQQPYQGQAPAYPTQPMMTPDPAYNAQQYSVQPNQPAAPVQPQQQRPTVSPPPAQPEATMDGIIENELTHKANSKSLKVKEVGAKSLKEMDAKKTVVEKEGKDAKTVLSTKSYRIQVATLASRSLAEKEMARIQRTYGDLIGTLKYTAQKVEGAEEIYRVVFGPFSKREDAIKRCGKFRAHGFSCIVLNPTP